MKLIGHFTTRGKCPDNEIIKMPLFDGRFDTAFRIIKFQVVGVNTVDPTTTDVNGVLGTTEDSVGNQWNYDDDRQIAWSSMRGIEAATLGDPFSLVDRENMVVEDLYIYANSNGGDAINYYIEMEKYDISEWVGALQLARNA